MLKEAAESDAQRLSRAQRMFDLLRNTGSRLDHVAAQAEEARPGEGRQRVLVAMQPTVSAVSIAVKVGAAMFT